jgi:hypothetical protein
VFLDAAHKGSPCTSSFTSHTTSTCCALLLVYLLLSTPNITGTECPVVHGTTRSIQVGEEGVQAYNMVV